MRTYFLAHTETFSAVERTRHNMVSIFVLAMLVEKHVMHPLQLQPGTSYLHPAHVNVSRAMGDLLKRGMTK